MCSFTDPLDGVGGDPSSKDRGGSQGRWGRACFQMWLVFIWRPGLRAGQVRGGAGCACLFTESWGLPHPKWSSSSSSCSALFGSWMYVCVGGVFWGHHWSVASGLSNAKQNTWAPIRAPISTFPNPEIAESQGNCSDLIFPLSWLLESLSGKASESHVFQPLRGIVSR